MRHKVNSVKPLQASTPIRAAAPADSAVGRHVASFRSQPVLKTGGRAVASCAMQLESSPSHEIYDRLHCRPVETLDWPEDFHERYELCGELGHGSFGTVEAARDKLTGTEYAVKIIPKHATNAVVMGRRHAHRARQLTKLKQEVKFLELFSVCPFAVRIVGAYQDDSYAYIVQEELYGGTLKEALARRGRFAEEQAAEAMFCIFSFLAECHSHNVHFGDVKLANFMFADVPGSGSCSDGGFGLLKGIDFGCSSECPDGVRLRTVMGTPLYAAPEQYRHSFDRSADLWAVGVVLYQLLSGGAAPFWPSLKGLSMVDLMTGATQGRVRWPPEVWQKVSAEAKDLILRLLQRDPAQRLSAMAALRHPFIANRLLQHPEWLRWVQPTAPLLVSNVVPFHACGAPLEQQQPQQVHVMGV